MVAVIAGNGLGLGNTSLTQLGQSQGGAPSLGQAGNSSYVNTTTGNLVLQSADEGVLFDGLPLNVLRTYNSLGQLSSNGWSYGFSRHVNGLTGTLNTAGSTITRTGDDDASVVYTYNATLGVYVSTAQSGAVDTLSWNATSSTWTWTAAAAQTQETYNATGQLTALTDTSSGASYSFSYSNGLLSQITAGDGDTVLFGYNTTNQLISLSIQEIPPGQTTAVTRQAVTYGYDTQGRLSTVTTTLGSDTDTTTASYSTTYTYQGTTDLVASVTQSDGTTVSYTYDASNRVQTVTTGSGAAAQTITLSYATNSTTVTDGLGHVTTYQTNAQGQLTSVIAPTVNGASPTTTYTYDANGNLLTSTDPNGAVTTYSYDANGNLLSVEDGAGNTVSYAYNAADQVTSKTTYTVPAQGQVGQSGYVAPSGAETTYYVYTATHQLAYTVDALSAVTEHDYTTVNGLSELTTTRHYLGATYSTSGNSPSNPPTLAQLQAWVQSTAVQSTLSQNTRTDYVYDVRGQLATQTQYDTVDSSGNGVVTHGTVITTTTYDAQGHLLHTSTETGANRSTLQTTTYAYDGLGRMLSKTDPLGNVTSYVYTDSANTIAITQANGLTTTQVRNSAGQLLSSTSSASGQTSRVTSYLYNAAGQAIAAIDAAGNVSYTFYDADGRVSGTIDGDGHVTAYTYDAAGQRIQTTQYATPVVTSTWTSGGALTSSYPTSLPVPASTSNDRTTTTLYNAAGQVVATIDPANNVTTLQYDGASHVLATTQYATALTAAQRTALGSHPTFAALQADLTASASNRTALTVYDADGRASATIDAQGYVTVTTYNAAGEVVRQTAYATALTSTQLSSLGSTPTLAAVQADLTASAQDQTTRTYNDGAGRVVATIDADGYLTTTAYDETTNTTTTTRYATALTSAQLGALTGSESVTALVALLGSNTTNEQSTVTTNGDGQVTSRTAVDGTVTTYTYNSVGQVLSTTVTPVSGQGSARTTSATYDAFGDTLTATDAATATTSYVYNTLGQQVEATDALGNSTWTYYDADGKVLYTIQGQPSGTTRNALGNVIAYTYDAFGEKVSTTTYAGQLTLITTGSNSGTSLNPTGATAAQVATAIAALSAVSGDANAVTTTTYTQDGQVATVTDGNGYQTARTYDAFGDITQVQQQLSQPGSALSTSNSTTTTYTYDTRGEQLSETDGVGTSVARTTSTVYDAFGRVTSRTDGNGNTITSTYDNLGRQVTTSQTVQGTARSTQTTYDAFGQVLTETDALGNTTKVSVNPATHTTTVTTPGGVTTTTVKDAYGDTVSVTDGGGNITTYTYDADGRLLTTTDALGNVSHRQVDANGDLIQTTDASGHVVTTTYDASGRVLSQAIDPSGLNLVTTYSYDGQGRQLRVTDPMGSATTYSYDADGHVLTKVVDATGLALTTTYTYDGAGKTLTVTTGTGTSAATTTQYVYDNRERLSQAIVAPGTLNLTTSYTYDANDNLVTKTDANGNLTRYVYDEANEQVFTIDPTGAVTQNWYDTDGRLTTTRSYLTLLTASQLSALGNAPTVAAVSADITASNTDTYHQRAYNADGQVVVDLGGVGLNATQYVYNAAGQVTQTRVYANRPSVNAWTLTSFNPVATAAAVAAVLTTSSSDLVTTTAYNADGQAVYAIDGAGDVTQTMYDAAGRVTKTIAYATVLTSAQLSGLGSTPTVAQIAALITTSANDRTTYTSYDNAGRVQLTVNAAGAVTQAFYDADGRVAATRADATPLTAAQLATLGTAPTPLQIASLVTTSGSDQVSYQIYDAAGRLRYTMDPVGYVTETRYDAAGRVTETLAYANALSGSSISTQNAWGPLAAGTAQPLMAGLISSNGNTDATAEATLSLYDGAGRRAFTVQQNNGGSVGQVTAYAYDANGNLTSQTVYGNALSLSTTSSLSAQLTTASVATAVASFTAKHVTTTVYDADHRALYAIDALGNVTQNSYDGAGRLIETQQYANPIALPGTINASTIAAAVSAAGTGGARLSTTTYDSRGDITATGDALGTNATYGYNALGQKASVTNRDGATWTYTYDSAGRLIQTQSPPVTVGSYSTTNGAFQTAASQYLYTTNTYDAFGGVTSTAQGYGTSASAITTVSTTSYAYDAIGHQVQVTDALNHVTTTTYNALGQLAVSKDANGNVSYRVYNDGKLAYAIDGNGYITAHTYDAYGNVLTTTQYATALNTSAITGWSAGQPLSLSQVGQGLVTSSSDRTITTTYDQLNQKTQVVLPSISYCLAMGALGGSGATGSPTTTYTYDAYGNLTSTSQLIQGALTSGTTTTPAVWATTYTYYDALNRAVMVVTPTGSYTSPQGYVTTTAYNAFGQVTSRTQYAQAIGTSGATTSTLPGLPGAATTTSGADRITTTTYDAIGRVASEAQAGSYTYGGGTLGQLNGSVGYTAASSVTSYSYNGENQVTSQTVNGNTTTTTYDAMGRVLTVTAPARQALVSNWQSILEGPPVTDLTNTALYTSVSPVTTYVYDAQGNALSVNVSAGGQSLQRWSYFDKLNRMVGQFDLNGAALHSTTYDANGNVLTQSYTVSGSTVVTTTNTYDADNQRLSTAVQRSGVSTDDSYTQQKYDAFGDVIAKGDSAGYEATYSYDNDGNLASAPDSKTGAIHTYSYDLAGHLVVDESTVTGGTANTLTHNWVDLGGNMVQQRMPSTNTASGVTAGTQVTYAYDRWGNVTSKTDANGNTTAYYYDSQNQVTVETEASVLVASATGGDSWVNPSKEWYYNVAGELMGVTDENGNTSWYAYDAVGNKTITQDNLGARTYTAYDALGRAVASQTPPVQTAAGTQANITFTNYDNLNQIIGQGYFKVTVNSAGATVLAPVMQSTYALNANGDRLQSTDALGNTITYTYDSQHRVLTSTTPLNETTTYVYDVNGNLIHQTDADGNTQSWTYNYFKQVQTHIDESNATYTYTYDANSGLLTKETSNWAPSGPSATTTSTLTFGYEANGALASLTEAVTSGSSTVTSTYGFGYDTNGNETLETISTQDGGGTAVSSQIVIGYDSHNRLQEVTDENTAGASPVATMRSVYVYDADGNRRGVFTRSAYDANGVAATPIPLGGGGPVLGTALVAQSVAPGATPLSYTVAGSFTDPLGMGLTFTATGLPSWLSFNASTGTFTGAPPVPTPAGSSTVTVTATDVLGRSVSSTFTVTVPTVLPVFTAGATNQTVAYNSPFSFTEPGATSANGLTPQYSASYWNGSAWVALPSWLSFNASTLTFSGTPPVGSAGTYSLTVSSWVPGNTGSTNNPFTLTVPQIAAPVFSAATTNANVVISQGFSFTQPSATDSQGFAVTYTSNLWNGSTSPPLPSWLSFNASTLTFSGTPPAGSQGTYTVVITAWVAGSVYANSEFSLTVQPLQAPTFSAAASNVTATTDQAFSFTQPSATDAQGFAVSYAALYYNGSAWVGLPSWISFNASSLTFSGTPPIGTSGTFQLAVQATAAGQPASNAFTLTVNDPAAPSYSGASSYGFNGDGAMHSYPNVFHGTGLTYQTSTFSTAVTVSVDSAGTLWLSGTAPYKTTLSGSVVITATDYQGRAITETIQVQVVTMMGTAAASPMMATSAAASTPAPAPASGPNIQADWFTYDADGRVLVADGALQNGQIVITTASNSATNTYDAAGDLATYTTETSAGQYQTQKNSYNALGQLTLVQTEQPGGTTYSPYETRSYDNDGRLATDVFYNLPGHQGAGTYNGSLVTFSDAGWVQSDTFYTYNADGELVDQSQYAEESAQNLINQYGTGVASSAYATQDTAVPSAPSGTTAGALYLVTETNYAAAGPGYGYDADGNVLGYRVTTGTTTLVNGQPSTSTSTSGYLNSYIKQNSLLLANTELTPITGSGSPSPSTTNTYNDLGELASSTGIVNGVSQSQVMAYTSGGQLLQKSTSSNGSTITTSYESVNENELGSVDTTGAIDVLSTTGGYSNSGTGTQNYTVRAGDTLQGLAQAIYGDSNYYYILAQANGLAPTATLTAGMMLTIPQVTTDTNAANTYQPYSQGALLSGSTNALYTTAQILAMSIDAVLNQQSAIAQSVAQVEEQEREVAAAQAQAEQAAQLASQKKSQLTQDEHVAATAQQQAAKAQGAVIAAQAAEQQAQAATPAQQAQAMELAKQAAYKVEADAIRKQLGSSVSEWTAVYGTNEALVRAYKTQRAWIINKPMRDEIWSSIEDSDSQGLNFSAPDGAPGAAYLQTQTEIDTYNQKMATRMVDAIYQASISAFFKNFTDKMIENLVNNAATDASGGDTTGGDGTDNSDGGGNGGGTGWSNFSLATAGTGVGGDTGGSVGDPSAYTQLSATATQDTSLYNQDNALVQQDRNNYQAASEQAQQDNTQVQQASTQAAQLDSQLAQETSSGGGLATIDSNGNGGNRDLYIGDGAAEQLIASEVGVGNATASTDSNSNNLASFLGGAQMLSDSSSLANLTNDTGGASSVLLGGTGGSGSLSSLTCSAPGLDGNAQGDQGQSNDPLLQSAEEYAKQGPSLYEILNGIGATPISFALGAYQGVQDGEQILKNQFSALPGEILNGIKSIPGKLAEADSGLLNFVFNTSQQQQGQIVGSILQAVSSNNIADSISSHLDAFNKSVIREFQTATPEQMGYDTGYNVTVNSPMIAANIALDGEAEALTCVADDGKGIFSASSLVPNTTVDAAAGSANSGSVWNLSPTARGNAIESSLANTEYSSANGWYQVGAENNGYFPLVDFQQSNTLVSLKTVDTGGSTWMGRMESHIDDLANNGATVNGQPANMVLDVRVPPGGAQEAAPLIQYGQQQGVTVIVKEYP